MKKRVLRQWEKARKKLASAEKIYTANLYEDAISRAYYAMFHAAKALLLTRHIEISTHSGVINLLGKHFVKSKQLEIIYAKMLTYAKELRENGDYETEVELSSEDAEQVLKDARDFLKKVEELINLSPTS